MGDAVIGEKSTGIIKDEYTHNSGIFHIDTSKNELEIDFSCYDDNESKRNYASYTTNYLPMSNVRL